MGNKIIDSEAGKNLRLSALYRIKAIICTLENGEINNPRKGYCRNIVDIKKALKDLEFYRAVEEGYEYDFDIEERKQW